MTRKARILLVDDRPENLLALEAILSGLGHELVTAQSGEEALKRLLTEDVAVILLDVQMPGMDGFETASHIKQRERTRDIPILFLTAIDGAAHQAFRGYAAGAVDFLYKPIVPEVLRAKASVASDGSPPPTRTTSPTSTAPCCSPVTARRVCSWASAPIESSAAAVVNSLAVDAGITRRSAARS